MSWTSGDTPSFAGSSILRESPPFHSSNTGPGGADLSLSELYISDRSEDGPASKPFSLLSRRDENGGNQECDGDESAFEGDDQVDNLDEDPTVMNQGKISQARTREERLQHDLLVLKKLNTSLSLYNDALADTRSSTDNVALQLDRTDRLLNQYVALLQHTETNAKLIFDKEWQGGAADQELLERLLIEKAAREREERERAARLEDERREKEEQERRAGEVRDLREKEKAARGVRGIRGPRGRVTERGASTTSRGRIPSASYTAKRGVSEPSSRGAVSTISRGRGS